MMKRWVAFLVVALMAACLVSLAGAEEETLTVDNCPELKDLLALKKGYDPSVAAFAEKYAGRIIAFDGNTARVAQHKSNTRFDFFINAGDYSETTLSGPNFQFRDVDRSELMLSGDNVPDNFGIGLNIHIVAKVLKYDVRQGMFLLEPVSITMRKPGAPNAGSGVLAFDITNHEVLIGKTVKLKPIAQGIDGKLTYTWEVSDKTIATVSNGTVKGVSGGQVTVACVGKTKDGAEYRAECTVDVLVPIKKITADVKSVTLAPNQHMRQFGKKVVDAPKDYTVFQPTIAIEPENASNKAIKWTSSNAIARVDDNGVITSISIPGSCTITGTAMDGSGKNVKIKVTVPKCFVTTDNIVIKEEKGAVFGYVYGDISDGFGSYSRRIRGDAFTIKEGKTDAQGMTYVEVLPKKAGSGSYSIIRNGKTLATVKIKVEKSAVRNKNSYPKMDLAKLLSDPEKGVGTKLHAQVTLAAEKDGLCYAYTGDEQRQYVAFKKSSGQPAVGKSCTVYGVVDRIVEYSTDSGLRFDCPVLTNVTFE